MYIFLRLCVKTYLRNDEINTCICHLSVIQQCNSGAGKFSLLSESMLPPVFEMKFYCNVATLLVYLLTMGPFALIRQSSLVENLRACRASRVDYLVLHRKSWLISEAQWQEWPVCPDSHSNQSRDQSGFRPGEMPRGWQWHVSVGIESLAWTSIWAVYIHSHI